MAIVPRPGNWVAIGAEVFTRDYGVCGVCGIDLKMTPDDAECGHLVDRCVGGADTPDNLTCMCVQCNRYKPIHDTLPQYYDWRDLVIALHEGYPLFLALAAAAPEHKPHIQDVLWDMVDTF